MRVRMSLVATMLALLLPVAAHAQSDSAQALAVVQRLFDGMRAADSAMVRSTMASIIRLLKDSSGWKITQLADTRRREHCRDVPR